MCDMFLHLCVSQAPLAHEIIPGTVAGIACVMALAVILRVLYTVGVSGYTLCLLTMGQ